MGHGRPAFRSLLISKGYVLARRPKSKIDNDTNAADAKKSTSLKPLLSLVPYLRRYPWALAGGLLALIASAAAMLALPYAVRGMIDQGFTGSNGHVIDRWFLALMLFGVVLALSSSSRVYIVNWLGERIVADLRNDVFRHVATLGPSFFERTHSGEVMSRLTADATQLKSVAGSTLSQALRNAIMLIGALIMMIATSPQLSGLTLLAIPRHCSADGDLWPRRTKTLPPRAGHPRRSLRLRCRKPIRRSHHASLRP